MDETNSLREDHAESATGQAAGLPTAEAPGNGVDADAIRAEVPQAAKETADSTAGTIGSAKVIPMPDPETCERLKEWNLTKLGPIDEHNAVAMRKYLERIVDTRTTDPARARAVDNLAGIVRRANSTPAALELLGILNRLKSTGSASTPGRDNPAPGATERKEHNTMDRKSTIEQTDTASAATGIAATMPAAVATAAGAPMDPPAARWVGLDDVHVTEPFCSLFPSRKSVDDDIEQSMRSTGYDPAFPMVVWEGRDIVVDGNTKYRGAKAAGLTSVAVVYRHFDSEDDALAYAVKCQRARRNLTDEDYVHLVQALDRRSLGRGGGDRRSADASKAQRCANDRKSADVTAEALGIAPRRVEQIRTLIDHAAPEVMAAVKCGDMTVNRAYGITQKSRRAAAQKPQSAPEDAAAGTPPDTDAANTAEAATRPESKAQEAPPADSEASNVADALLVKVDAPAPTTSTDSEVELSAVQVLTIVLNTLDSARPGTPIPECRKLILAALEDGSPALIARVMHTTEKPATKEPKKEGVII
jgi:ParB family chromosome partitioning protein